MIVPHLVYPNIRYTIWLTFLRSSSLRRETSSLPWFGSTRGCDVRQVRSDAAQPVASLERDLAAGLAVLLVRVVPAFATAFLPARKEFKAQ